MSEITKAGEQQAVNDQLKTKGFVHRVYDKVGTAPASNAPVERDVNPYR